MPQGAELVRCEQASVRAAEAARNAGDASLAIFGTHDEGTIGEMRNCMSFGRVGGVLCCRSPRKALRNVRRKLIFWSRKDR
jgi:hypothetical protein